MASTDATASTAFRKWGVFLIAFVVVVLDQISKHLVRTNFTIGQSMPESGIFRLTYYTNTGAAFSILPDRTTLFIIVAFVAIAIIVFYSRRLPGERILVRTGLGLQLGGAIGNLTDRLVHGQVTDFIDISIWPVFNIADTAVFTGVGLLAYFLLIQTPKPVEPVRPAGSEPQREPQREA
ncbi:MAG: signal peptidase II [Dehalococcoidia bacterium]|nr:signal peptidase II [Dehalococcoidia bacterium]